MGMKAMYLTEVKTRLLPLEKEIKRLAELVEKAGATEKARYATSIKEFRTRFAGIQEDLALLQSVDEGDDEHVARHVQIEAVGVGDGAEHHQAGFVSEADRFGAVTDEIDTTPTDDKHAPAAPAAPVWTMKDDIPDTTPSDEPPKPAKKGWWQRTFSGE